MTHVLLISGKQGSGKSTLQRGLQEWWERDKKRHAVIFNFADVIYEMHDEVLKILHRYIPPRPIVKDGPLLQLLGTEWGRNTIDPDIWVNCLRAKVDLLSGDPSYQGRELLVIIGDCRFENEFKAFPDAIRIRLEADEEIRKKRCSMWRESTEHPSECGLDRFARYDLFDMQIDSGLLSAEDVLSDAVYEVSRIVRLNKEVPRVRK